MNVTTRRVNFKNAAVAAVACSALVLAACGSEEDNTNASADTTTTATSTSTATSTAGSEAESSADETTTETTTRDAAAAANGENGQDGEVVEEHVVEGQQFDPNNPDSYQLPVENAQLDPVEGGAPASPEDAQAITALLNNINNETTLRGYLGYIPNNACTRVLDEAGGRGAIDLSQIPDVPLNAYPDFANAKATINSVDDIVVNGDEASALVTASTADGTTTETQRFLRENGRWTFCD